MQDQPLRPPPQIKNQYYKNVFKKTNSIVSVDSTHHTLNCLENILWRWVECNKLAAMGEVSAIQDFCSYQHKYTLFDTT